MQHTDSQSVDTSTLVFLKNPMRACVRIPEINGLNGLEGVDRCLGKSAREVCCLGFRLRNLRNLRETHWGFFVHRLSTLT